MRELDFCETKRLREYVRDTFGILLLPSRLRRATFLSEEGNVAVDALVDCVINKRVSETPCGLPIILLPTKKRPQMRSFLHISHSDNLMIFCNIINK